MQRCLEGRTEPIWEHRLTKRIDEGRYAFEAKLRSVCTCVMCGFTERLSDEIVSDLRKKTAGCPVHGDGSWPPKDRIEFWTVQDYFEFIEAFLSKEVQESLFLKEFSLQFEGQSQEFPPEVFSSLFDLYTEVDRFFVERQGCQRSAKTSLRQGAKRARDQLRARKSVNL